MEKLIRRSFGFSLLELMIVIAIMAILAVIAIPNYQDHVRKSRRGDAQSALIAFAGMAERNYTQTNSFVGSALPANTAFYTYSFPSAVTAVTFTIRATPVGGQAADDCGTMNLTHTGQKSNSGTEANCWN